MPYTTVLVYSLANFPFFRFRLHLRVRPNLEISQPTLLLDAKHSTPNRSSTPIRPPGTDTLERVPLLFSLAPTSETTRAPCDHTALPDRCLADSASTPNKEAKQRRPGFRPSTYSTGYQQKPPGRRGMNPVEAAHPTRLVWGVLLVQNPPVEASSFLPK